MRKQNGKGDAHVHLRARRMLMRFFISKKTHSNENTLKGNPQKLIKRNAKKSKTGTYYTPINWSTRV